MFNDIQLVKQLADIIQELREEEGMKYKEIDAELEYGFRSYRFMNHAKVKDYLRQKRNA
jgi:hypothetical protein